MIDKRLHTIQGHFEIKCLACGVKNAVTFAAGDRDLVAVVCKNCYQGWGTDAEFLEGIVAKWKREDAEALSKGLYDATYGDK